ncbi:hypothetical protein DFJ77DRAFT_507957 [Powellomyces hirtus]|nr:hypothetical protein DFJ77DRAFT_507957 [Powellomyces hirtus]
MEMLVGGREELENYERRFDKRVGNSQDHSRGMTDPNLFKNDGNFLARFLQQQKEQEQEKPKETREESIPGKSRPPAKPSSFTSRRHVGALKRTIAPPFEEGDEDVASDSLRTVEKKPRLGNKLDIRSGSQSIPSQRTDVADLLQQEGDRPRLTVEKLPSVEFSARKLEDAHRVDAVERAAAIARAIAQRHSPQAAAERGGIEAQATSSESGSTPKKRSRWGVGPSAAQPDVGSSTSDVSPRTAMHASHHVQQQRGLSRPAPQYATFHSVYQPGMIRVGSHWAYPEDEIVDDVGTYEHRKRALEIEATSQQSMSLAEQAEAAGAHHLAHFIPNNVLQSFEAQVEAKRAAKPIPKPEDHAEHKLGQTNIGFQMLKKQGWKEGSGLGSNGSGVAAPISAGSLRADKEGLGQGRPDALGQDDDDFDVYRKRMMLAYKYRYNGQSVHFDDSHAFAHSDLKSLMQAKSTQ